MQRLYIIYIRNYASPQISWGLRNSRLHNVTRAVYQSVSRKSSTSTKLLRI